MAKQQLTYAQIQEQINALQAQAEALKKAEVADVVGRIREAIRVYGLTAADLGLQAGARGGRRPRAAKADDAGSAKYGDGKGQVWGGRGPRPKWLREAIEQGHALEEFLL